MEVHPRSSNIWKDIAVGAIVWALSLPILPTFLIFAPFSSGPLHLIDVLFGTALWERNGFLAGPSETGIVISFIIIVALVALVRRLLLRSPWLHRFALLVWLSIYVALLLLNKL